MGFLAGRSQVQVRCKYTETYKLLNQPHAWAQEGQRRMAGTLSPGGDERALSPSSRSLDASAEGASPPPGDRAGASPLRGRCAPARPPPCAAVSSFPSRFPVGFCVLMTHLVSFFVLKKQGR